MSKANQDTEDGWCVASTKPLSKSRIPHNAEHKGMDVIKKIESYISKAKKFKHTESILIDLLGLKDITQELNSQGHKLNPQWIIK